MKTDGTNLLVLTITAFWSPWPSRLAPEGREVLGGRYRQVSLYNNNDHMRAVRPWHITCENITQDYSVFGFILFDQWNYPTHMQW